ncbi:MAG TPA: hypothetical protein VGC84_05890, partial [Ilumatobacteraceae bacterium]
MTTYTVSIDEPGVDAVVHRMVLASLPNSYRLVDGAADVAVVSAHDPEAVARAIALAPKAVVVDRPGRLSEVEVVAMQDLARRHDCLLVPSPRYAPRTGAVHELIDADEIGLTESTITSSEPHRSSFAEQLAVVRNVLGAVSSARMLDRSPSHFIVQVSIAERRSHILLNGFVTVNAIEQVSLRAVGVERRLSIEIDGGPLARPARIRVHDAAGDHGPWPRYEHALRLTLAKVHDALTNSRGAAGLRYTWTDLQHDVGLADLV